MSPSNNIAMPIAVNDKSKASEHMWNALKQHIIRDRQRKKQEREAEVEEERLRKEREAREQQDVMSLGETREQISQLELKLAQLKEEKHQLFLQLKKVLNEDDNRRRQLVKENNDMLTIQALPSAGLVHPQLFIPQSVPRVAPVAPQGFKTSNKRTRSPSPPTAVPVSLYHQGYAYKPQAVPNTSYQQPPPQKEDNRRGHELVRAVLWNKTPQYANQPNTFYTVPPQEVVYYPPISREPQIRSIYDPAPRPQTYHIEQKHVDHYSLRPSGTHVTIHGNSIPLTPAQAPSKSGSITSGYPVRSQTQYQQAPAPASALYTASARPLYQSPGTPMSYPQRE
ncbi:uncharacterized protein CBL_04405 [Carabus blaptoides fortunei]